MDRRKSSAELKDRWGVGEGETLFCLVGRFMEQKGVIHLIEAVAKLVGAEEHTPPFRVLMVGDGGFIGEYKKIIADRKLDRQFIFTGFIPEVRPILAAVNAIVVSSLWEASSLVSLEAFSVGCPVIASNCIGLREVVATRRPLWSPQEIQSGLQRACHCFCPNRPYTKVRLSISSARQVRGLT